MPLLMADPVSWIALLLDANHCSVRAQATPRSHGRMDGQPTAPMSTSKHSPKVTATATTAGAFLDTQPNEALGGPHSHGQGLGLGQDT